MRRTLWRASYRHGLRHPWQLGLGLLGIALGVAVVVAVDLALESARRAFLIANESVVGRATHHVVGGPTGVPETVYVALRATVAAQAREAGAPSSGGAGGLRLAPVIERHVGVVRTVRAVGMSPRDPAAAPASGQSGPRGDPGSRAAPRPAPGAGPGESGGAPRAGPDAAAPGAASKRKAEPSDDDVRAPVTRTLTLLGVDPFAEGAFRGHLQPSSSGSTGGGAALLPLLTRPGAVLASRETAARLDIAPGDSLSVRVDGKPIAVELVGHIEARDELERESLADLLIADIATAQEVLGLVGRLTRIDVREDPAAARSGRLEALAATLPPGLRLEGAGQRARVGAQMTDAFHLNLLMLGLLALVVGMFLIYNTMTFNVVRRRGLIGMLRAVGVTRGEVLGLVLIEAALLGALGSGFGVLLGIGLARELIELVTRTINDLYLVVSVRDVHPALPVLVKGGGLGLLAALIAAAVPALEAARIAPRLALTRSSEELRTRRLMGPAAIAGGVILLGGGLLLLLPTRSVAVGFVSLFATVAGFALMAPLTCALMLRWLVAPSRVLAGALGPMALNSAAASLGRTSVAVAALMVALAATVGVGVMVDSFRETVARWLDTTLRADLYVGVPGRGGGRRLAPGLERIIATLPGVAETSLGRGTEVASPSGAVALVVLRMATPSYRGFVLVEGDAGSAWPAFDVGGAVLVSEPYAWRHRVGVGDAVRLFSDRGEREFPVAAVFRDYGSERGTVLMSRATYERHWDDRALTGIGVYLADGASASAVVAAIEQVLPPEQEVVVRANEAIKAASLEVFDRTFEITLVLRWLATLVAFLGVLGALMALQLERGREVGILRVQGLTRLQVFGLLEAQTGAMGLIAGALSVPLGLLLALVLIHVINRRSFGWGMEVSVDSWILLQAMLLALVAALLAGLYPAWRMARLEPAEVLREE